MNVDSILEGLQDFTLHVENAKIPEITPDVGLKLNTPLYTLDCELQKNPHDLHCGHLNTVSIPKRRDLLEKIIRKFQIFGASESNVKSNTPPELYNFEGYKYFGTNRNNCNFGGVGLYISDLIECKRITVNYKLPQPEMVFVQCKFRNTIILVGVIYKSPGLTYKTYDNITEIIANFTAKYSNVILLGDFNINFGQPNWPETKHFKANMLEPFGLEQIVTKHTRITDKSRSLIDLILINNPTMVKNTNVIDFSGLSDHCLVFLTYSVRRPKPKPKKVLRRDFKNFKPSEFNSDVENISWENLDAIYTNNDLSPITKLNKVVTSFESCFCDMIDKHAPFREVIIKKPVNPSWMTDELLELIDKRDLNKIYFNETGDIFFHNKFKELKNTVTHAIRKAKVADFNANINNKLRNVKQFHANLKTYNVVESGLKRNDVCSFDPTELNNFFSANNNRPVDAELLAQEIRRIESMPHSNHSFSFREVSETEVKNVVRGMKSNSCGIDKISLFFVRTSLDKILTFVTEIFNFSIRSKIFPDRWKIGIIIPIPKVKSPSKLKDYRPISLLSVLAKIFEKLMANQMKEHLLGFKLLDIYQSGYKPNHGCTTALLHISDYIYNAMDDNELTFLILLDYSKAFDIANHKLILAKLAALGFDDSALTWLGSYLEGRYQKVVIGSVESSLVLLKNGVPQGSILGPLLFTILVNDISKCIHNCQYHLYADDTQLYLKTKVDYAVETIILINNDLERIANFSKMSFLKINEEKSKFLVIGSKNNLLKLTNVKHIALAEITMNSQVIQRVVEAKNLGIVFDQYMSWNAHINGLISGAYFRLKLAYRYSNFLTEESKYRVTESYILALFNYASPVLQNLSYNLNQKIQKLQNSCVRYIFNLRKYDHISSFYAKRQILKISDRRDIQSLTIMHNIVNNKAPEYLTQSIRFNYDFHGHNTRTRNSIRVPKAKTGFGYNRFFRKYAEMYNNIQKKIRFKSNISKTTFKIKVKKYLINARYSK